MRALLCAILPLLAASDGGAGSDWRFFAAGGLSAGLSHGYTTPIDVVKTRMQSDKALSKLSLSKATKTLIEQEGVGFLAQGFAPTVAGYGVEGALKFGCYELLKPVFAEVTSNTLVNRVLASVVAGAVASVVLCPAEEVRIKMVADPSYANGTLACLSKISEENGVFATFSGFPAMCAKQVPYTMGKQVSFDYACTIVRGLIGTLCGGFSDATRSMLDEFVPLVAAFPAAILACVMSHPGDMLLTQYYKGSGESLMGSLAKLIERNELFRGLRARLVHVISIIWVQLIIYDKTKQMLGLPATGH